MKKILLTFCLLICFSSVAQADYRLSNHNKKGLYATTVEQMLNLTEEQIDIGTAALIISENWSENVFGKRCRQQLDDMAIEILARMKRKKIPPNHHAVKVINEYLFDELGFDSVSQATNPDDLFLHSVLDNRQGYCLSLSILYLALGERIGLPLYGVVVPGHFFVKYDDGHVSFNIETTSKGLTASDEHYIKKFNVPTGDSIYMKTLTKAQALGCFLNNLGNSYNEIGDYDQAILSLQTAVEINPSLAEARINLGNIYLANSYIDQAINEYKTAIQINSNNAKAYNNLGNAYAQKKLFDQAVSQYNLAISLDPQFVDAHKNIAIVFVQQQQFQKALFNLKKAQKLASDDYEIYNQMADVYYQMSMLKKAVEQFNAALKINPRCPESYFGLAVCYNKQGLREKEIQAYKKALVLKPDMAEAMVNLGSAYFDKKDYENAVSHYKTALQISPQDSAIYYNLGAAYSNSSKFNEAQQAYIQALSFDSEIANAHNGLAYVLYKLEKYQSAWQHFQKAKQLGAQISPDLEKAIRQKLPSDI